jgi:acyl-CoA synthetase (NDP forming)
MDEAVITSPQKAARHPLAPMFEPASIALVGASEKSYWTHLVTRAFAQVGFAGELTAVNRSGSDVFGIPGFKSCKEIGKPVDAAFLVLPQEAVLDALEDLAAANIRYAVVLSSGYAEVGAEGRKRQDELIARARALGVTLWGPNALGFINLSARTLVSSMTVVEPILPPSVAIITQSGASAIELNEYAHSQNIGCSFLGAMGNEAMINIADVVDYLVDHEPTKAIAIFCETIRDPVGFARAAERARQVKKPVVIFKIGRGELAAKVAQAHTGSILGEDRVFDAVCERLGVVRVRSAEDMIATAGLMAATGPLAAPGLSFMSVSGGACTIVADAAEAAGVHLPPHPPEIAAGLREVLSDFGSALNPLDVTGALLSKPDLYEKVIPLATASPQIGLAAVNIIVPTMEHQGLPQALPPLGRALAKLEKPAVIVTMVGKSLNQLSRDVIAEHGLPHVMTSLDATLRGVSRLAWWSEQLTAPSAPPLIGQAAASAGGERPCGERAVLERLAARGVPVIPGEIARTRADAERIAAASEGPLVLKIAAKDIAHKTEAGGVRLDVAPTDAGRVFDQIIAAVQAHQPGCAIDGVIVSPMRKQGVELLVGVKRDPEWGAMLAVGFGGVLVELLTDVATAPLPVRADEVKAMLGRLRGAKLLKGYRGAAPADLDALADVVVNIAETALDLGPDLESLEVNPLLVDGARIEALDALATWR